MNFAQKIKSYRNDNKWTQQEVAERLNVSRKTISSWETNRSYPDIFMLVQISDLYQVSLDNLLREDRKMIDSYKQEHISSKKRDREFRNEYLWNVFGSLFILLKLIHVLPNTGGIFGAIIGAVIGATLVNLYFLLNATNWNQLSKGENVSFVLFFIVITCLSIAITFIAPIGKNASGSSDYVYGIITGKIVYSMIYSLALTCTISLFSQFKERKEK